MVRHITARVVLLSALLLTMVQTSLAQTAKQDDLCSNISTLIEASKTSFVSILGDTMDEKERTYVSKVELSGWGDGFVHPEDAERPFALYVSLGGNTLSPIKKRYKAWVPKLSACLRGWKRTESVSVEEVKSVFTQTREGTTIQLDYNIEPSNVGDTKYDLYLTIKSPAIVIEQHFCRDLSTLLDASRNRFASIAGAKDGENGSYKSTLRVAAWGSGWVYPEDEEPNALYIMLGGNRLFEIKRDYQKWVSNVTTCVPSWKRTRTASREEVETVFRESPEGLSIGLKYNLKPDKGSDTKYDLYLTIQAPRVTQKELGERDPGLPMRPRGSVAPLPAAGRIRLRSGSEIRNRVV